MFDCCHQTTQSAKEWVDSSGLGQPLLEGGNEEVISKEATQLKLAETESNLALVVEDTDAVLQTQADDSREIVIPGSTFSFSIEKIPQRTLGLRIIRSLPQVTGIIVSIDEGGLMGGGKIKKWDRIMSICGHDAGPDAAKLRAAVAAGTQSRDFSVQLQRPEELVVNLERNKDQNLGLSLSYCTSDNVLLVTQVVEGSVSDGLAGKHGIRVNDCIVEVNKFKDDSDAMLQQIQMEGHLTLTLLRYAS